MSQLGDLYLAELIRRIMRDVSSLSPSDPSVHFLQQLEAQGLTIVKKAEAGIQTITAPQTMTVILPTDHTVPQSDPAPKPINATAERLIMEAKAKRTKT